MAVRTRRHAGCGYHSQRPSSRWPLARSSSENLPAERDHQRLSAPLLPLLPFRVCQQMTFYRHFSVQDILENIPRLRILELTEGFINNSYYIFIYEDCNIRTGWTNKKRKIKMKSTSLEIYTKTTNLQRYISALHRQLDRRFSWMHWRWHNYRKLKKRKINIKRSPMI